jgi:hypothetical protein
MGAGLADPSPSCWEVHPPQRWRGPGGSASGPCAPGAESSAIRRRASDGERFSIAAFFPASSTSGRSNGFKAWAQCSAHASQSRTSASNSLPFACNSARFRASPTYSSTSRLLCHNVACFSREARRATSASHRGLEGRRQVTWRAWAITQARHSRTIFRNSELYSRKSAIHVNEPSKTAASNQPSRIRPAP